jgi:hypothetical protein
MWSADVRPHRVVLVWRRSPTPSTADALPTLTATAHAIQGVTSGDAPPDDVALVLCAPGRAHHRSAPPFPQRGGGVGLVPASLAPALVVSLPSVLRTRPAELNANAAALSWCHGHVASGNVLVVGGSSSLSSTSARPPSGIPACDLVIALDDVLRREPPGVPASGSPGPGRQGTSPRYSSTTTGPCSNSSERLGTSSAHEEPDHLARSRANLTADAAFVTTACYSGFSGDWEVMS